jgi:ADP-ribosylglycohydrolase
MWGCIAGDIAGSVWEGGACPPGFFQLFPFGSQITDDSVCVAAVASAIVGDGDFAGHLRRWVRHYPSLGYGADFKVWALTSGAPAYGSWSNGAAMRVAPVALEIGRAHV